MGSEGTGNEWALLHEIMQQLRSYGVRDPVQTAKWERLEHWRAALPPLNRGPQLGILAAGAVISSRSQLPRRSAHLRAG